MVKEVMFFFNSLIRDLLLTNLLVTVETVVIVIAVAALSAVLIVVTVVKVMTVVTIVTAVTVVSVLIEDDSKNTFDSSDIKILFETICNKGSIHV